MAPTDVDALDATPEGEPGGLTDIRAGAPEPGIGICLSGGGYRAMLFHVGSLWRLHEAGLLDEAKRTSSVSGGLDHRALLGLGWSRLGFDPPVPDDFVREVVGPIRRLAGKALDVSGVVVGALLPGSSVADRLAAACAKHLFGNKTLQDLPDVPRFVINATNVQSGVLWRFSKPYMWDYRVGKVERPTVRLATEVAASAAFPPFLSPLTLDLDPTPSRPARAMTCGASRTWVRGQGGNNGRPRPGLACAARAHGAAQEAAAGKLHGARRRAGPRNGPPDPQCPRHAPPEYVTFGRDQLATYIHPTRNTCSGSGSSTSGRGTASSSSSRPDTATTPTRPTATTGAPLVDGGSFLSSNGRRVAVIAVAALGQFEQRALDRLQVFYLAVDVSAPGLNVVTHSVPR